MRKIEKRAVLCLIIALALIAGLGLFCFRFVTNASDWAAYPYNRHMYSNSGQLLSGTILDRDGDVLTEVTGRRARPTTLTPPCAGRPCTRSATARATSARAP